MITAVLLAEQKGAISLIVKNDLSHISIVIMALYVILSGYIGRLCYLSDQINKRKAKEAKAYLASRADIGWFAAEHFFSLGLLGTIIGLCIATSTNLTASAPTSEVVAGLKMGLNTAFYTTVCGIVFSLPLQMQLMILKYKLDCDEKK